MLEGKAIDGIMFKKVDKNILKEFIELMKQLSILKAKTSQKRMI